MATRNMYVQSEADVPDRITVHVIDKGDDDGILFVPERTCTIIDGHCSACGDTDVAETKWYPSFCPCCGSRVVS